MARRPPPPPEPFPSGRQIGANAEVDPFERRSQAERVIARFGNARRLARIMAAAGEPRHYSQIYRWTYPKERGGCDGVVPSSAWRAIRAAARLDGVLLREEDFDARPR